MDGIVVLDLVLIVVVVVVVLGQLGMRRVGRASRAVVHGPFVPRPRAGGMVTPEGERLESALAAWVCAEQLSRDGYRRHMAELAAADDVRRPLTVPLD